MKIRTKDRVIVVCGKNKGVVGEVLKVSPKKQTAIVQGVNIVKRHQKASRLTQAAIVEKEAPIHLSNLAIVDPKTSRPTRIGFKTLADGRKVRYAKRSNEIIDL